MRNLCLLLVVLIVCLAAVAQDKPCIAFSPDSVSETETYAKDPLATAVALSGDFIFYSSHHYTCWNVHVLAMPVNMTGGTRVGYAISYTVTDLSGGEVGHGLLFGPDNNVFDKAMRDAAADAIKDIRLTQFMKTQSPTATPPAKK
jgi:hypothetical protein